MEKSRRKVAISTKKQYKYAIIGLLLLATLAAIPAGIFLLPEDAPQLDAGTSSSSSPTFSVPSASTSEATTTPTTLPATEPTQPPATTLPTVKRPASGSTKQYIGPSISSVKAKKAFVYDLESETYLFLKSETDALVYPASITKLFSAYMILQYLSPDHLVTAGDILKTVPRDSSVAGLKKGDTLTVKDLLAGMLLPSGGDASRVLAAEAGRAISRNKKLPDAEAMAVFMKVMNFHARYVGMTNSQFINPDGYHHTDHFSCMADILIIARLALETPLIMELAGTAHYSAKSVKGKKFTWHNSNYLLQYETHPSYWSGHAIGLKTGYTKAAGACLLAAFNIDGHIYITGVFKCPTKNGRYPITHAMLNSVVDVPAMDPPVSDAA
jgi:D-alanyl-D-alanine carboxypeptidase (penicillin-binding protein 5/6)